MSDLKQISIVALLILGVLFLNGFFSNSHTSNLQPYPIGEDPLPEVPKRPGLDPPVEDPPPEIYSGDYGGDAGGSGNINAIDGDYEPIGSFGGADEKTPPPPPPKPDSINAKLNSLSSTFIGGDDEPITAPPVLRKQKRTL